jgi:hypothetical protein
MQNKTPHKYRKIRFRAAGWPIPAIIKEKSGAAGKNHPKRRIFLKLLPDCKSRPLPA